MAIEIIKDGIKLPEQTNLTWVFPVRLNGRIVPWKVDSFDLNLWFKEALGRYPNHERGDKDELADLLENWARFEPRLRSEAEKLVELGAEVAVDGLRTSASEWQAARVVPKEDLPPLTDAQREVAKKLGVAEEEYARSFMAGEKTWDALLEKTKKLVRLLQNHVSRISPDSKIDRVTLRTWDERFDVTVRRGDQSVPVRIQESVVDDLFERGSSEAEQNLVRILEIALESRVH